MSSIIIKWKMKNNTAARSYCVNWFIKQRGGVFGKDCSIFGSWMIFLKKYINSFLYLS